MQIACLWDPPGWGCRLAGAGDLWVLGAEPGSPSEDLGSGDCGAAGRAHPVVWGDSHASGHDGPGCKWVHTSPKCLRDQPSMWASPAHWAPGLVAPGAR